MKIIKYYCDVCKKEVESEKDFIKIPYINNSWDYFVEDNEEILEKEICIECLKNISNYLNKISKMSDNPSTLIK